MFVIPVTKREKLGVHLIAQASTQRLIRLRDKGGPLSDFASDELYLRNLKNQDPRVAEAFGTFSS